MKLKLAICLLLLTFTSFAFAEPIQITAQWSGVAVRESAQSKLQAAPFKMVGDGVAEPVKCTIPAGKRAVIEVITECFYPTVVAFSKTPGEPVQQTERETRNVGLSIEITAVREGEQIVFHGQGILTRLAAAAPAESAAPQNQPSVASTTFVSRECTFAGRAPVGTPVKLDIGEKGVDAGALTLTFANAK